MTNLINFVGIDISKVKFDVSFNKGNRCLNHQYENNLSGFNQLLKDLPEDAQCVMEATGPYYLRLAVFLHKHSIRVSVVNPLVIKRFSQMRLLRTKTDKADAKMIMEYGSTERPGIWTPPDDYVLKLQQMEALVNNYIKQRAALCNQSEAFTQSGTKNKSVENSACGFIQKLSKEISKLEAEMEGMIEDNQGDLYQRLLSIPGIGKKTALMLIIISGGFTKFDNSRQLASYVGLCPRIFDSGTSIRGKAHICKMGMSKIRALLYICAWSAIGCNKACKELYHRLKSNGKSGRVALIAVANKLLKQAFAIAKKGTYYNENYAEISCL
jgi:transposase